jgi:endonuclease III
MGEKFLSKKAKAKTELHKFKNDLREEKILEQEECLKMLIAQVLSQNPRSPLSIDEIYGLWEKYRSAEETIDQASEEIIEGLEKILQDNASVEEVADETPVVAEAVTDETTSSSRGSY